MKILPDLSIAYPGEADYRAKPQGAAPSAITPRHIGKLQAEIAMMTRSLEILRQHQALLERCAAANVELPFKARTMANIASEIADRHKVTLADLKGPRRCRAIAWPRQEVMWTLSNELTAKGARRWSSIRIGQFLGGRDHATVLHGVKRHQERLAQAIAAGETL